MVSNGLPHDLPDVTDDDLLGLPNSAKRTDTSWPSGSTPPVRPGRRAPRTIRTRRVLARPYLPWACGCCGALPREIARGTIPARLRKAHPSHGFLMNCTAGCQALYCKTAFAGVAQLVEHQPSKLNVDGSSPFARFEDKFLAERKLACLPV